MKGGDAASGPAGREAWTEAWTAAWPRIWQSWRDATGLGILPNAGAGDALGGVADGYAAFAQSISDLAHHSNGESDLGRRLAALLRGEGSAATGAGGATLHNFLRSVPPEFAGAGAFTELHRENLDTLLRWAAEWLELPVFGPQREWLESVRDILHAALAEQRAANRMNAHRDAVIADARERFATFLDDESGPPITSVRALYDIWIDTAEAAYAEAVMSVPFSADFATWVDAGSTVRLRMRALVTRLSALVGVPQREELETLLARQRGVRDELEALRREVAELRAAQAAKSGPEQTKTAQKKPQRKTATAAATRAKPRKTASRSASPGRSPARSRKRSASPGKPEFDIGDILAGKD